MSPRRGGAATELSGAPIFAALGHETRLRLVSRLCAQGPASIAHLTEGSGVSRQAVTKHLRILADAGLVQGARQGRESSWELRPEKLDEARRSLDHIAQSWAAALDRLTAFVLREEGGGT